MTDDFSKLGAAPFVDPFESPLFLPSVYRLTALLGLALVLLLILRRDHTQPLKEDALFHRWRTWIAIVPIYLLGVLSGPAVWTALIAGLSVQGLREYALLVQLPTIYRRILLLMGLTPAPLAAVSTDGFYLLTPLLLILATLQPLLFGHVRNGVRHLAFAALGWGYIPWFLAHLVLMQKYIPGGTGIILALGVAVAMSDIGAFTLGKAFGRHQMSRRLSPNKTMEGALGNWLGAYLGLAVMGFALPDRAFWLIFLLPLLIGAGALWGDLVESAIKREFHAKDAGSWLPGFGGLLDRIDSLIIVAPLVYYFLRFAR